MKFLKYITIVKKYWDFAFFYNQTQYTTEKTDPFICWDVKNDFLIITAGVVTKLVG